MRMRRNQLRTVERLARLVTVEPILTRLEAGDDRMPRLCRVPGCMLARGAVTATDVSALRAPAEMKPPSIRRRQAFHAPVAARFRSRVDSAPTIPHFDFSSHLT